MFRRGDGDPQILLVERKNEPYKGCWALPGGFLEPDETLHDCAVRELREETGLLVDEFAEVGSFSAPDRDPRRRTITIAFVATIGGGTEPKGADDAVDARFWSLETLPALAFDHADIVAAARRHMQGREPA